MGGALLSEEAKFSEVLLISVEVAVVKML